MPAASSLSDFTSSAHHHVAPQATITHKCTNQRRFKPLPLSVTSRSAWHWATFKCLVVFFPPMRFSFLACVNTAVSLEYISFINICLIWSYRTNSEQSQSPTVKYKLCPSQQALWESTFCTIRRFQYSNLIMQHTVCTVSVRLFEHYKTSACHSFVILVIDCKRYLASDIWITKPPVVYTEKCVAKILWLLISLWLGTLGYGVSLEKETQDSSWFSLRENSLYYLSWDVQSFKFKHIRIYSTWLF